MAPGAAMDGRDGQRRFEQRHAFDQLDQLLCELARAGFRSRRTTKPGRTISAIASQPPACSADGNASISRCPR
jgi:hypothetical protein